jgi:hypothetical protein
MVRTRLVLLVTIAALVAPWVAPCLAAAPADHSTMPCCRSEEPTAPAARPCCAPTDDAPALPSSSSGTVANLPAPVPIASTFALPPIPFTSHVQPKPLLSIQPRVLFGVLLI